MPRYQVSYPAPSVIVEAKDENEARRLGDDWLCRNNDWSISASDVMSFSTHFAADIVACLVCEDGYHGGDEDCPAKKGATN